MKFAVHLMLGYSLLLAGCNPTHKIPLSNEQKTDLKPSLLALGSISACKNYSGLPNGWLKDKHSGMVQVDAGTVNLGSNLAYPDEINFGEKQRQVSGFWIDQTEVTVAQFESFVHATGYMTDAERQKQAAVFLPDVHHPKQWWQLKSGYTWQTPNGPNAAKALPNEPVRFVTKNDAEHYAVWLDRDLPSEIEWEYAAKAGQQQDTPLHQQPVNNHHPQANYWQGEFPFHNNKQDHFAGIAPVGCFDANNFKLYDMIGNVWEWTSSVYQGAHDQHMGDFQHLRQTNMPSQNFVIKGGSYLCADNYCARFRNSSRYPQEFDLATSHVGFRTIKRN